MCCVISTGTRGSRPRWLEMTVVSACGPPVDEPISRTRGGTAGNGAQLDRRRKRCSWARAGARMSDRGGPLQRSDGASFSRTAPAATAAEHAHLLDEVMAEGRRGGDAAVAFGFRNVVGGAERERLEADLGVAARQRRRHDHDEVTLLRQQQRQRRDAIELRHLDVEDDDIGIDPLELVDRIAAVAEADPASARAGSSSIQRDTKVRARRTGVVDHHDADCGISRRDGGLVP